MGSVAEATPHSDGRRPLKALIVGCGLGGLSCAISCLKEGMEVEILEKAKQIGEIGAGIQIPPNASRVLAHYGLVSKLEESGAILLAERVALSYKDGSLLVQGGDPAWMIREFGHYWYNVHRVEYHQILLDEARQLGAKIHLDCDTVSVDTKPPSVTLSTGRVYTGDVLVGADGLRSLVRDYVLGYHVDPQPTGDMAYRMTIPRKRIEALHNPYWTPSLDQNISRNWWGPNSHAVFYPVRNKTVWNMVLCRPDDLPPDTMTGIADAAEVKRCFTGWDPKLQTLLQCVDNNVLKWKICHMSELESWTKDSVALLGDACHPTLPYQAQGAAMAVEDGAALGILIGSLSQSDLKDRKTHIPDVLRIYEAMRKRRTTINVQGAIDNRHLFQMADEEEVARRNQELQDADLTDISKECRWGYADLRYQKQLMGFDTIKDAREQFQAWIRTLQ